jgi:DNA-binding CsgD family transcriptional regulator
VTDTTSTTTSASTSTSTSMTALPAAPEALGLGLPDRVDHFALLLRSPSFTDGPSEGQDWLQACYDEIVPLVLPAALHSVETGEPLPAECLQSLRTVAAGSASDSGVQLSVILRGAFPAMRVFAAFMHETALADTRQTVLAMARSTKVAQELGSCWVEAWSAARAAKGHAAKGHAVSETDATPVDKRPRASAMPVEGGSIELVAADPTLSDAEARMLALAAYGHSNEHIARATSYSRQAVGWHLSRIMRAWKTPNRTALVAVAFVKGVLVARFAPRAPLALPASVPEGTAHDGTVHEGTAQDGTTKSLSQPTSS